jgi:hypothetical protein
MYTRKSLLSFKFSWTQSKSRFRTFFWLSVGGKLSLLFLKTLSPGVSDLVSFFQKNNFSFFEKDALRLESNIFETFRFATRKISRWKNLSVFQRLMFLYQLVNLVLETCFIFSKTLKLSKTFLSWVSRLVRPFEQWALWFPYSRFWNKKCSRKC